MARSITTLGPWLILGFLASLLVVIWPLVGTISVVAVVGISLIGADRLWHLSAVILGGALPLLMVAWLHRRGPGAYSGTTETGGWTTEYLDPLPWLTAGLIALALGGTIAAVGRALASRRKGTA